MTTQTPGADNQTAPGAAKSTGAGTDATELLIKDHKEALGLFAQFDAAPDPAQKGEICKKVCGALKVHTQIEEELFYPAARDALKAKDDGLVDEALEEHAQAKRLIGEIEAMQPGQPGYDDTVRELAKDIKHHATEEETQMFPKVRQTDLDLQQLGRKMAARKEELTAKASQGGKALS